MDLLAANDQENRVRSFQPGAAGKPLNNGGSLKPFAAKTPAHKAPKTPFKVPLNDENATFKAGKSGIKTIGKGNAGAFDKNAFRDSGRSANHARPLGHENHKCKNQGFPDPRTALRLRQNPKTQSPVFAGRKSKSTSPSLCKMSSRKREREIEYMPPREVPLPDEMDDLPLDWKFPMFEGKNLTRGIGSAYFNPVGDDGLTKWQREEMKALARDKKKSDEEMERIFADINAKEDAEIRKTFGVDLPKKTASVPSTEAPPPAKPRSGPSTLKSRSAAAALSPPAKPSYLASTASIKSKVPSAPLFRKTPKPTPINPSASRHAAAITASKSTIGYAQSRATSTSRKPLSNLISAPPQPSTSTFKKPTTTSTLSRRPQSQHKTTARTAFSRSSSASTIATLVPSSLDPEQHTYQTEEDVDRELRLLALADEDDEDVDAWMSNFMEQTDGGMEEEEFEDFQLQLPEGL